MIQSKNPKIVRESSSFRDPSGFVFYHLGKVYRQIDPSYLADYEFFKTSLLAQKLIDLKLILDFKEVKKNKSSQSLVLETQKIPFISYPYEWSFDQIKDAALLTLEIQKLALDHQLSLKDASAFNIQFLAGKPILIDLLSFERYRPGQTWPAYRQFCQHFLAPLLLMAKVDVRLNQWFKLDLDGIPLDLASRLLPKTTYFNPGVLSHLHLHAKNQQKFAETNQTTAKAAQTKLPLPMLMGIIDSLKSTIVGLKSQTTETEWGEYYTFTNYSAQAFQAKKEIIAEWLKLVKPKMVWDLGANNGEFSRLASDNNIFTIAFDIDPKAVAVNYQQTKLKNETQLLPLQMDLVNPSPSLGWQLRERKSLIERGPADLVMALALVHHLAISRNLPFELIAEFFSQLGKYLIIEFVPKTDSKVQILLSSRPDIFPDYQIDKFELSFSRFFKIVEKKNLGHNSERVMYLMKRK